MFQDYYSKERNKSKLESLMKCRIMYTNSQTYLVVKREISFMHKEREKSKLESSMKCRIIYTKNQKYLIESTLTDIT